MTAVRIYGWGRRARAGSPTIENLFYHPGRRNPGASSAAIAERIDLGVLGRSDIFEPGRIHQGDGFVVQSDPAVFFEPA